MAVHFAKYCLSDNELKIYPTDGIKFTQIYESSIFKYTVVFLRGYLNLFIEGFLMLGQR